MLLSNKLTSTHLRFLCWAYIFLAISIFIKLELIKFIVYLLFVYLVSDLFINFVCEKIPSLSKIVMLYITSLLFIILTVLIMTIVIPKFITGAPLFINKIQATFNEQFSYLIKEYNLDAEIFNIKEKIFVWIKQNFTQTFNVLQRIGMNIFLFILAIVINFAILHNRYISSSKTQKKQDHDSLLFHLNSFSNEKMHSFYTHFKKVMSAQLIISVINSALTLILLFALNIPYKVTLIVLVFIFGLLPVIGNLISNTIICSAAFVWAGLWPLVISLGFLVTIHKLEYILNSKIIGHITALPIYITLLALIIGELLFNISGMILAIPTVLFIREELRNIKITAPSPKMSS